MRTPPDPLNFNQKALIQRVAKIRTGPRPLWRRDPGVNLFTGICKNSLNGLRKSRQLLKAQTRIANPNRRTGLCPVFFRDACHRVCLADIAAAFGLTESRICQIHTQAVKQLRAYLHSVLA
jgi:hypothetical protein